MDIHCVKSVRIWSCSGPYFLAFGFRISPYSVRMRENKDQNNSENGHFLRSDLSCLSCSTNAAETLKVATINCPELKKSQQVILCILDLRGSFEGSYQ